jgi:hypothetical protein
MIKTGEFNLYVISFHSIYGDRVGERRYEAKNVEDSEWCFTVG